MEPGLRQHRRRLYFWRGQGEHRLGRFIAATQVAGLAVFLLRTTHSGDVLVAKRVLEERRGRMQS